MGKEISYLSLLVVLLAGPVSGGRELSCPKLYQPSTTSPSSSSKCYRYFSSPVPFQEAKNTCQREGARLASSDQQRGGVWLDLQQEPSKLRRQSSEDSVRGNVRTEGKAVPSSYPELCSRHSSTGLKLVSCDEYLPFVCEKNKTMAEHAHKPRRSRRKSRSLEESTLPVVSFRLDDVQAWWCRDIQETIINVFLDEEIPLNLGIIGEELDISTSVSEYLLSIADDPLIEMTSHSLMHNSFEGKSYDWQYNDMSTNNNMITAVTGVTVNSFIPPMNEYDNTTINVSLQNGMNVFSAECVWSLDTPNTIEYCKDDVNVVAPHIVKKGVFMLPAGAVLGGVDYWEDFLLNASLAEAIDWIEAQIDNQGFSVVMLHPVEFALSHECNVLNLEKVQILKDLIAYGRTKWNFQTFTNAARIISAPITPTELPSSQPSASPTIISTSIPSSSPTAGPSRHPSYDPSSFPSAAPASDPTSLPTVSSFPSSEPTVSLKPTTYLDNSKPVVSFRLDDVQSFWCEDISQYVIDLFISEEVPVNVGIIGEELNHGTSIDDYLLSLSSNLLIEMTSHSFVHDSFEGKSYIWQWGDMDDSLDMISSVTTVTPTSFIPPRNEYDNNTLSAAKALGIRVFSPECTWSLTKPNTPDHCKSSAQVAAPHIERDGLFMLPTGAVLGGLDYWQDFLLNASLADAVSWIELQIDNQGFSVVMLHPVEFATSNECTALNEQKIQVLKDLFVYGRSRWQFKTFTDSAAIITSAVTPTSVPSPTPTYSPTILSTGRPSGLPSGEPTSHPSGAPSVPPSTQPSVSPSSVPTLSALPTSAPSVSLRPTTYLDNSKPVVSFRLDDVQSFWCEDISQYVIDLFISEEVPVNVGIIGEELNHGTSIDDYLLSLSSNLLIEMTSHSFVHDSFEGKSYIWQWGDMDDSLDMISSVTTVTPTSFIPPRNEYDNNTLSAAKALGIRVFSPECTWSLTKPNTPDHCKSSAQVAAPHIERDGLFMLPTGAVLGGLDYWQDFLLNASLADAVSWIELQIDNQGFSVVMLHPVEFATSNECTALNEQKIQVLKDLFVYGRSRWQFKTFTDSAAIITSAVTPTSVPSPTPTYSPTILSTGRPSGLPSGEPTSHPSGAPSVPPSTQPSVSPSSVPTLSALPTSAPSVSLRPTTYLDNSKPVVSFRLDGVQAYWCESISQSVIDIFLSEGVPLNVGVIGRNLDTSVSIGSYLKGIADNSLVELSSNSFKYQSFEGKNLSWQSSDMEMNNEMIDTVTSVATSSFIPPMNEFDNVTVLAAKQNGLGVFSAECTWSLSVPHTPTSCDDSSRVVAPHIQSDIGVYMLPAGAVLGGLDYWQDFSLNASVEEASEWIELQIDNQGFSVVMLRPVEFATSNECTALNEQKIQVLKDLFVYGRSRWQFKTFTDSAAIITSAVTPTSVPSPTPTYSPTILSTGRPSGLPSGEPTSHPSGAPSVPPSTQPSVSPSSVPTLSALPTSAPSVSLRPTTYLDNSKPVVSFRLDGVQAYWCESISQSVIDIFLSEGVPLNVGVIGRNLDTSVSIGSYLKGIADNSLVELSSNSFKYQSFEGKNLSWQSSDMEMNNEMIDTVTSVATSSFIPPMNEFDNVTVLAAKQNGLGVFSAECTWSLSVPHTPTSCDDSSRVVAPHIQSDIGVYMLPAGAVLGGLDYWQDFSLNASVEEASEWIELQIDNQGFSVVMLRPVEFATSNECTALNEQKIQVLKDLFVYGRSRWQFKTFTDSAAIITSAVTPTSVPSPTPTYSPTILSTGRPSGLPSGEPTSHPSGAPSVPPSTQPSVSPSSVPTLSALPTSAPSVSLRPTTYLDNSKPVVSFRLDGVQAYWCESISQSVIDIFLSEGVPLNVGVIGRNLDTSVSIGSYLKGIADNSLVELSSNSFKYQSFEGKNLSWQSSDMEMNNEMIDTVTSVATSSFIPPMNEFDNVTVLAAKQNGLGVFSAECTWSLSVPHTPTSCDDSSRVVAPHIQSDIGVYMLPAGAVLGGLDYWQDFSLNASVEEASEWIELQIDNQGFSVVMLRPVEFATSNECTALNEQKIQVLKDLFVYGRSRWQFKTFTDSVAILTKEINPTASPSKLPTIVPSSSPVALPSVEPSAQPVSLPTSLPSLTPSSYPSIFPSAIPSSLPLSFPSAVPTISTAPSRQPTIMSTGQPTFYPSSRPSASPTNFTIVNSKSNSFVSRVASSPIVIGVVLLVATSLVVFGLVVAYRRYRKAPSCDVDVESSSGLHLERKKSFGRGGSFGRDRVTREFSYSSVFEPDENVPMTEMSNIFPSAQGLPSPLAKQQSAISAHSFDEDSEENI